MLFATMLYFNKLLNVTLSHMHDSVIVNIPINDLFVRHLAGDEFTIVGDLHMYGVRTHGGLNFDPITGQTTYYDLKSPFESLPSSYENMAFKFYHISKNCVPYVSLNASPKILQGHNVYGSEYIQDLVFEMLGMLKESYPVFWQFLNIEKAEISRIDVTYSTRLPHDDLMNDVIDMIGRISVGQRKPDLKRNVFNNTRYWGVAKNRVGYCKMYGKQNEVGDKVKSLKRKARANNTQAKNLLEQVFTDELESYAKNLLRFEATNKKDMLVKQGIPSNLWQFILYQRTHKDCLFNLWQYWFNPILEAMQGEIMANIDDNEILQLCREKLKTITPSGRESFTKAMNAYRFYVFVKDKGFIHAKSVTPKSTFNDNIKLLCDIGIPKSHLQNLTAKESKSIQLVELIKFDFSNQCPPNYVPPKSRFSSDFEKYLKPQLQLVA